MVENKGEIKKMRGNVKRMEERKDQVDREMLGKDI